MAVFWHSSCAPQGLIDYSIAAARLRFDAYNSARSKAVKAQPWSCRRSEGWRGLAGAGEGGSKRPTLECSRGYRRDVQERKTCGKWSKGSGAQITNLFGPESSFMGPELYKGQLLISQLLLSPILIGNTILLFSNHFARLDKTEF